MQRALAFSLAGGISLILLIFDPYHVARGGIIVTKTADYSVATPTVTADTALGIPGAGENRTVSVLVSNAGPNQAEATVTITGNAPSGCTVTPAGDYSGTGVSATGGVNLLAGTNTTASRDFTINCTANGNKTFVYSASVSVLPTQSDGSPAVDPDTSTLSNGPKTVQQTVTVSGIADLAVTAPTVTLPGPVPTPGANFSMTVATAVSNSGFSPANADVSLGLTQVGGADCTITPGTQSPANPISLGPNTNVSRGFTVNCSQAGNHTFQSSAQVALAATGNVIENNTVNNGPLTTDQTISVSTTADLVVVISSATAAPDVDSATSGVQQPINCTIPCQITVNTTVKNLGPIGPASADVTVTLTPPAGCNAGGGVGNPASASHNGVSLGGPTNFSDVFTVSCTNTGSKTFSATATIALSPGQPLDNPPNGNNAGPTNVVIEAVTDADGDGIPDSADQCTALDEDKDGVQDGNGCPDTDANGSVSNLSVVGDPPTGGSVNITVVNGNYGPAVNVVNQTTVVDLSVNVTFSVLPTGACTVTPLAQPADADTSAVTVTGNRASYSEEEMLASASSGPAAIIPAAIIIIVSHTTTLSYQVSNCNLSLTSLLTVTACVDPTADTENASPPPSGEGDVCTSTNPGSTPGCCYRVDEEDATDNTSSSTIFLVITNDLDNDGVLNTQDKCADTPQPTPPLDSTGFGCARSQVDSDGDGFCGDTTAAQKGTSWCPTSPVDNCPSISNPSQTNTDAALAAAGATIGGVPIGDGLGDACDNDDDNDGTSDTIENFLGTNPLDNCGTNAWPSDTDSNGIGNGLIDNLDFLLIVNSWLKAAPDPAYIKRADIFDGNGVVDNLDMIPIVNFWLKACT